MFRLTQAPILIATVLTVLLGTSVPAYCDFISVLNPSFERPAISDGSIAEVTDWGVSNQAGIWNPLAGVHFSGSGTTDGQQAAWVNVSGSYLSQVLATALTPGLYTLEVDVGDRLDFSNDGYIVALYAGGSRLAQDDSSLSPNDGYLTSKVTYLASAIDPLLGQALEIRLGTSNNFQSLFDNVRLDGPASAQPVPEPSSLVLLGTGAIAALGLFGRQAKHSIARASHKP